MEGRGKDVEELRAEVSHQSNHYKELCAHGTSLEEVQMLCSQVIALKSDVKVESAGGWLRGANRDPKGSSYAGGSDCQPGRSTDQGLGGGQRTKAIS